LIFESLLLTTLWPRNTPMLTDFDIPPPTSSLMICILSIFLQLNVYFRFIFWYGKLLILFWWNGLGTLWNIVNFVCVPGLPNAILSLIERSI
jgi:hypothetical protein